jgi:hypothetical protein
MLAWNAERVKKLTGIEIWLLILGRVFVAFGIGVVTARYYPAIVGPLAIPAIGIGLVIFLVGAKGLFRSH